MGNDFSTGNNGQHTETSRVFLFGLLAAYVAVEMTGMLFHPLWRDEIHPWAMAGSATSLWNLIQLKVNEGHPDLWYILVYGTRALWDYPLAMQFMHSAIAVTTVFLILKYAPFSRLQRGLLVFGYFYLFEYAVISRNYAAGILMITLLLVFSRQHHRFMVTRAILLFIMAQANVYGLIFSMAYSMAWAWTLIFSAETRKEMLLRKISLIITTVLILSGTALSVYSIIPEPTGYFAGSSDFSFSQLTLRETVRSFATIWKSWFPMPKFNMHFWDSNFISEVEIKLVLSLVAAFSAGVLFFRRPMIFVLYVTGMAGMIAMILMYYFGYIRHHGHLYILLIACLWLMHFQPENTIRFKWSFLERYYAWLHKNLRMLFLFMLTVQVLAAAYALTIQFIVPFSAGRETAGYITHHKLDRYLVAGDQDVALETIAGYLNREAFFFSRRAESKYLIYDTLRKPATRHTVLLMADSLTASRNDTILLVMNYPLNTDSVLNIRKIKSFEKSIQYDEIYYLYLMFPATGSVKPGRNLQQ